VQAALINFGLFQLSAIPGMKQLTTSFWERTVYLGNKIQIISRKNVKPNKCRVKYKLCLQFSISDHHHQMLITSPEKNMQLL